jgi:tRNA(fMet)-specific endonuclease VapC
MDKAILDTDILSEILKGKDRRVLDVADRYLAEHQRLTFSAITFYEVLRGLYAAQAIRAFGRFFTLAYDSEVLPITISVLTRAAGLWANAREGGFPHNDADLIIAATAIESGRVLVTGNTAHFSWIQGLVSADWRSGSA